MAKCDFYETRGWASDYCLKKDDYVSSATYNEYCNTYKFDKCPIYCNNESSGGCYLTTACVEYKGLEDDCYELTTLRAFRDNYITKKDNGASEVLKYYETAPEIVECINKTSNKKEIYEGIYNEVIAPCVDLIEKGQNEEAYIKYKSMVEDLTQKYIC